MNARTRTYFISDLHLGSRYVADRRRHERAVVGFLHSIRHDARALYLLGDILDYWYEYRTVVPRGYVRFFGALAGLADAGVEIYWIVGNHDVWLFDYLRDEIGITVLDPKGGGMEMNIDGTVFFLAHGDGIGRLTPGVRAMRAIFRSRICQTLYAAVHPRWTVWLANSLSSGSRSHGLREGVAERTRTEAVAAMRDFASGYSSLHPEVRYIVMGHHHVALDEAVGGDCRMVILGDWLSLETYAVFDGENLVLKHFERDANPINKC